MTSRRADHVVRWSPDGLGGAVARAAYTLAKRAAQELVSLGTYGLLRDGISFADLNARLTGA